MTGCQVVVVGAGIAGAAVAYQLASQGAGRVYVCDQSAPAGRGATAKSGGLLRQHHTARCDVELAVRGTRVFHEWNDRVGDEHVYHRTGFAMVVGQTYADHLAKNVAAINEAGGSAEVIGAGELVAAHPGLRVTEDAAVAYEADGGYADPVAATVSLLRAAARHGAVVFGGVRALELVVRDDRLVGVRTNVGLIEADQVVLCIGAWAPVLLRTVGVDLPLTPKRIGIARAAAGLKPGAVPICIDDTLGTYFRPAAPGGVYFGVPLPPEIDPDGDPGPMPEPAAYRAAVTLAKRIPALAEARLDGARVGFDGYTPDKRPVIGPAGPAGLYLCTAFSGGGVKLAPAVGELVAEELLTGRESPLLAPYRPDRFQSGTPVESEFPYATL